jgi:hypothetical protein
VTIDENKRELHPTKLGMALIKGLKLVDKVKSFKSNMIQGTRLT